MTLVSKPLWSEGMLVRPQHLQQYDRWIEHVIEGRAGALTLFGWGLRRLTLATELLPLGTFAVHAIGAVLPDGTVIDSESGLVIEPRTVPHDLRHAFVKLGVGVRTPTGGGGTDPTDTEANADKTITLWIMQGTNAKTDEYVEALKTAFTEQTGATLDVQVQPWDGAHDKFVTAMSGGTGPDVAEVGTTWTPEFADAGGLSDLTAEIEEAGLMDGLVEGLVESGTLDDKLYGMPWYAGVRSILGNKEKLEAAGVAEQPQSWDDLLTMITTLKESDPDSIPFPIAGVSSFSMLPFVWGAGGDIATEEGGEWTSTINSPEAVEGLTWYTDLALKHDASTAAASTWLETDSLAAFLQGDVGMFITGSWVPATIEQDNPDLDLPEDDEAIEAEPVTEDDLPEVDPYDDDEDAVLDDDEEN